MHTRMTTEYTYAQTNKQYLWLDTPRFGTTAIHFVHLVKTGTLTRETTKSGK